MCTCVTEDSDINCDDMSEALDSCGTTELTSPRFLELTSSGSSSGSSTASGNEVAVGTLLPKLGTKSSIWCYFGLREDGGKAVDDGKVVCRLCYRSVMAKSGNTSNIMAHIRNNQKAIYSQLKMPISAQAAATSNLPQQQTIKKAFAVCQPYCRSGQRWKELTESDTLHIKRWIASAYSSKRRLQEDAKDIWQKVWNTRSKLLFSSSYTSIVCYYKRKGS